MNSCTSMKFKCSALYVGDADAEGNARAELLHTTCGTPNYVAPEVDVYMYIRNMRN